MQGADQSWVTLASNDTNAWEALVLARSLKRTFTTRKLTVLITEDVAQPLKVFLQREFDLVLRFETSEIGLENETSNKAFARLWCWNLRGWSKCVFLDPNSIVLQNSDSLFELDELCACPSEHSERFSSAVFVLRPNVETFKDLIEIADTIKEGTHDDVLNQHFKAWMTSSKNHLSLSYNATLDTLQIEDGIELPKIFQFTERPWEMKTSKYWGQSAKIIANTWIRIFVHEILPGVSGEREHIRAALNHSIEQNNLPTTNGPKEFIPDVSLGELKDAIAVIGMSCRFPGADDVDEYWSLLTEGRDPIRTFPSDRPRSSAVKHDGSFEAGFLKCPVDEFDAKFFGISPREAPFVDPQQRILLEVIWESLENANINPQTLKESDTGVFMGVWQQDYDRMLPDLGLTANDFHHRYLGNAFSATASRISYFLGLYGPNYSIESGCSSSSSGVHLACSSLRRGETSLAISSGVNLVLNVLSPLSGDDKNAVVLSKDHRCKTFDESADGFVRAEGCGSVVLKRYADARRDGDNVLALIRGTALNNDGPGTSFGTPNARAQERVFRQALKNANVLPKLVSYVEAHGTGTMVGDPTEMYAIGQVYSEGRTQPLLVSSVKTNIGHAEACAGMAGLIKVILCLKNNAIPPHLHLKNLNPRINLESIPATIPTEITEWKGEDRIAAVSSFSMSGTNVHMIIQEPPTVKDFAVNDADVPQMIGISAKTPEALSVLTQKYVKYLEEHTDVSLTAIAYSANVGRAYLSHRVAVVAKDRIHLVSQLRKQTYLQGKIPALKPKVGFLFTGQGSQYSGMANNLYESNQVFKAAFDRCDRLFLEYLRKPLKEVVWTDPALLELTMYCQPAIFCIEYSLVQLWRSFNIQPDYVLGHSVGEFAAAVCAGILSLEDAMHLVVERSRLVNALEPGSMMAAKASEAKVSSCIRSFTETQKDLWVDIAAVNSEEEVVVSGNQNSINKFGEYCLTHGIKYQLIPASHAFHSREMDHILTEFGETAGKMVIGKPKCEYVSGTIAKLMGEYDFTPQYWQRHLRDTVRFSEAIKFLWSKCNVLVEIGAQPILLGLSMANINDSSNGVFCPSLRKNEEDRLAILTTLGKLYVAGIDIDWKIWFGQRKKQVSLPTYPFQRQKYWYVPDDEDLDHFQLSTTLLHPILGRQMPAPISDTIFCQKLLVRDLQYVSDHKVAERIIVPGAAYLECIMAAGREVLQGGGIQVPLTVENLSVKAALELEKACNIQTVVSSANTDEGIRYEISIHRQVSSEQADKWKRHAEGTCSPTTKLPETPKICLEETKARLTAKDSIAEAYKVIAEMGIQFGPKFQSIISAWSGVSELLTEMALPENPTEYICHPIVLDAMIQTYAFRYALSSSTTENGLQLPIGIKKFVWLSRPFTNRLFAYTNWANGDGNVGLYNEDGEQLAIMEGLELVKTTTDSFLRALNSDGSYLPSLFEEIWKPTMSITRSRVECNMLPSASLTSKHVVSCLEQIKELEASEWPEFKATDEAFLLFVLRGIQECNWGWPAVGEQLCLSTWKEVAPAQIKRTQVIESFFKILVDESYLMEDDRGFRVAKSLPSIESCDNKIQSIYRKFDESRGEEVFSRFMKRCGQHFTSVLHGDMTPLAYMFPEDSNEIGAYRFYSESKWYNFSSYIATSLLLDTVSELSGKGKGTVRILEVGAGSGKSSAQILDKLADYGVPVHYTFTDISPMFIAEAKKKLKKDVTFGILNIEEDPLSQGFAPHQYDIVMAMQVVHAVTDVKQALTNIKQLLRPEGVIILSEQFQPTYKISLSFGMLDGWWRFNDFRKLTPIVNGETWKRCLTECGFNRCNSIEIYEGTNGGVLARSGPELHLRPCLSKNKSWLLVGDDTDLSNSISSNLINSNRNVIRTKLAVSDFQQISADSFIVNPESPDDFVKLLGSIKDLHLEGAIFMWDSAEKYKPDKIQQHFCAGLLHLCQALVSSLVNLKDKPKLFAVTRGLHYIGDAQAGNPNAATSWGLLKSFSNENPDLSISMIDTDQDMTDPEKEAEEVFAELWNRDREMFISLREDKKFVQRLVKAEKPVVPINLPNSDRFRLVNPESHSFADLSVVTATKNEITGDKIEVCVHACALNFRDLFMVLQPEGFDIPDYMSKEVGLDIAGVVTATGPEVTRYKVGDEVFGFATSGGLASHNVISEKAVMRKPKDMTFTSASTVPVAFLTVFYSLIECAKMDSNDRILIHVATGGVGLAAIQVAKHVGAEIYATAGSKKKRAYLRSLGIKNVYHSRNTEYGQGIAKDSNGKGVTVVLNSLTGPNFKETSLKACAQGARFVEIGKVNIWKEEEVTSLRPDAKYFIVDLAEMAYRAPEELEIYTEAVNKEFQAGLYAGLPHDVFPLDLVREAFHHFQEAKHIGKIVVTIPKPTVSIEGRFKLQCDLFNKESTYLITGGLGGLGMEVTKWMTAVGAKNVVLVGRNSPNSKAQELIDQLNQDGSNVIVVQADVGKYEQCVNLLESIERLDLPPIRGIMHAAGVISDATVPNQSWDKYSTTLSPKVYGGWNLHSLTLDYDLEFFVMFSSVVAIVGMPGQSNHAAANRFLDSLAHYRISIGRPATSINFGPWSDVGAAAHIKLGTEGALGMKSFTPKQGILSIEKIMRERRQQVSVADVADWNVVKQFIGLGHYLDELRTEESGGGKFSEEYAKLLENIKSAHPEHKQEKIKTFLEIIVRETLRLPENDPIDPDQNFTELGVDSLMAMEMRNRLQGLLVGKTLTISALQENRTIQSLSTYMATLLNSESEVVIPLTNMVIQDSVLPNDITAAHTKPLKPSQFKEVLLTGSTGHLGSHLLLELNKVGLIVHCLIRAKDTNEAQQKLVATLRKQDISRAVDLSRVRVVVGDVSSDLMGVSGPDYEVLSDRIDAVIHSAIRGNHIEGYGDGGELSMRKHNVLSLNNVLRFAGSRRTKPVLHASSILAVSTFTPEGLLSEEYPEEGDYGTAITNGYSLSKFVSEKLLAVAAKRGIPITVLRYPSIFGNSESGLMPADYNHAWNILLSCIRVRMFPKIDHNGLPIMPVDVAARISTALFLSDTAETGIYNLTSNSEATEEVVRDVVSEFGVDGDFVPFSEWRDAVFKNSESNLLSPLSFLYEDEQEAPRYLSFHPLAKMDQIKFGVLSPKLLKNFPGVSDVLVPAKLVLQRHLNYHFNQKLS